MMPNLMHLRRRLAHHEASGRTDLMITTDLGPQSRAFVEGIEGREILDELEELQRLLETTVFAVTDVDETMGG